MEEIFKQPEVNEHLADTVATKDQAVDKVTIHSNKKWLSALLVLLIVGYIVSRLVSTPKQLDTTITVPEAVPTVIETKKDTSLTIATESAVKNKLVTDIPVTIDTGENIVSVVELHVLLSPYANQPIKVVPGTFFEKPTILSNSFDKKTGIAKIIIGSLTPKKGMGVIATLAVTSGAVLKETQIQITSDTRAAAIGEESTVIKNIQSGILEL